MNPSSSSNFISGFSNSTQKNPKDLSFNATAGNRSSVKGCLSKRKMAKVRRQETRAASGMDNRGVGNEMSGMPEDCVANVMSFTSPRDACRFSVVSSLFRSAAESDIIWERFLPPGYESIVARWPQSSTLLASPSKKQLYFTLCSNPILIDNGRMSLWLDKWSGKKCYMLSARDLLIDCGDNPTYWRWTSDSTSRFEEVAELLEVVRLEISSIFDAGMLSPSTLYVCYFVFKLSSNTNGLDHAPTKFSVGFVRGESTKRFAYFQPKNERPRPEHSPRRRQGRDRLLGRRLRNAKQRVDGWMEIEMGEFFCEEGEFGELVMHVKEIPCGCCEWKSGLIVGGIEIRPKHGEVRS